MFENVLEEATQKFLEKVSGDDFPPSTYLAGGTAIALQLGHRKSVDLDFFTPTEFSENQWEQKFIKDWNFKLMQKDWQTLTGQTGKIKLSLFYYKYKLIGDYLKYKGVLIASLPDLVAMKLNTVISRSTKRDFIDLYFLGQKFGIKQLFGFYNEKYGDFSEKEVMIKKSLIYFEEAEKDEMPNMLMPVEWKNVKKFFLSVV